MRQKVIIPVVAILAIVAGVFSFNQFAPDFKTLKGESYQWRELEGQWVVVNFFAEWCAPCLKEFPELNRFSQQMTGKPVHLFGVNFDGIPPGPLQEMVKKYQIRFPVILTTPHPKLPMEWPISLPTTYIINPQGEVVKQLLGEQSAESLTRTLKKLEAL
ncbi:hypothetical protein HMF8227_01388 [Saliniradius amylolyticus]|uniref:Thioredoxin domain-containing protein n=1 Tax=Saliniradius amylolyticus TaxID=2183582 RepID=A0A2S2E2J8_9ALTE|nr:TlpA disulfide reductase family protein [Saliniradius amylolyticus]AWL11863.1 hypothetical protein HMF8227_01388 [Saliniradius amylolyticus]